MSTRRRIGWFVGVGVSQACLTVLAVYCIQLTTEYDYDSPFLITGGGGGRRQQHILRGGPVVWSESTRSLESGPGPKTTLGPPHHCGSNPVVPTLMVALAIGLPPAVAGCVACRRKVLDANRQRASRMCQSARVVVLAATAGLMTAAVEVETARGVWPPPLAFIDRLIDYFRPDVVVGTGPDGTPVYGPPEPLITGSDWYSGINSWATRVRDRVAGASPPSLYPVMSSEFDEASSEHDPVWRLRTQITLVATGLGLLIGCLIFRPWRRSGGRSPSDGAAVTTPPPV